MAFVPVTVMPPPGMLSVAEPVFFRVAIWVVLVEPTIVAAKTMLAGVKEAVTLAAVPVPVRVTFCGEPMVLSATLRDAVRVPVDDGLKLTVMVQLAVGARVVPQVVVSRKDVALAPVMVMLPEGMGSATVPVFLRVAIWVALVDPTGVLAKVIEPGVRVAVPAPLPLTEKVAGGGATPPPLLL